MSQNVTESDQESDVLVSLDDVEVEFEAESGFFEDQTTVTAVNDVTLDIKEKGVVAIVGESGCGKTTLGKVAIGLQRPTDGTVEYRGQDIWAAKDSVGDIDIPYGSIRRSLQIIHQDPESSLNPNRTVQANMSAPLKKYRPDMSSNQREKVIISLLDRMGIHPPDDYATRFPHQLSGGEQQRIALGRALLMEPDLILADEAVSALDVSLRVEMMDLMLDLRELFDTSYIFISHDFANARYITEKTGGRIAVMYLGEMVEIGPVQEVLQNPKHPYTQVLVWSTPSMDPDVAESETSAEPPVRSIDIPDPAHPPTGCKFHSRCQEIIPPDDINISQEVFNELTDLRIAINDRTIDPIVTWRDLGVDPNSDADQLAERAGEFARTVRNRYFDTDPPEPHLGRVNRALEQVATEDWDAAVETLDRYESVCEQVNPELNGDHPVACHLYDPTQQVSDTSNK